MTLSQPSDMGVGAFNQFFFPIFVEPSTPHGLHVGCFTDVLDPSVVFLVSIRMFCRVLL